jgi:hypothetical protein|tara:strand:- start:67 stop:453 length:387 start_codon:yes stop_codon:yes gene_type:complete
MIYSKDPEIEKAAKLVDAALVEYHSRHPKNGQNPYENMCYVASIVLKNLVGRKVILWKVKDHNRQFHYWCISQDGEVIDLTKQQYELKNIPVPSTSRAAANKEQGRRMSFSSYKKKEDEMMDIIKGFE